MTFAPQLKTFLEQSLTTNQKTKHFTSQFIGLEVKVSFGQGGVARIPWISFLADGQTTSQGIYPVYLYFKKQHQLILAYGVSETNPPLTNWEIENSQTIAEYFKRQGIDKPERYGSSIIYKAYEVNSLPSDKELDKDLSDIIKYYKYIINDLNIPKELENKVDNVMFSYKEFHQKAKEANLLFSEIIVTRFASSLLTKPFVILTGLSGSGKTKLAQSFASWLCEDASQFCIIPVGADWTNREPLLGFPNALNQEEYVMPQNGALKLIIESQKEENINKPYFLILDEMNLSHVERYFADFLSAMESKCDIDLYSGEPIEGIPEKIKLPPNLFIIGTVNIDETTYMFSPKVLDRANVIEFRITESEMSAYLNSVGELKMELLEKHGAGMSHDFVAMAKDNSIASENTEEITEALISLFKELKAAGAEFGYRSASEILKFATVIKKVDADWTNEMIIDAAIMQKLLPKVHGSRKKLVPVLERLGGLCLNDEKTINDVFNNKAELVYNEIAKYPVALEKITRMYHNLMDNGFTSYAEA